jgi:hypothetical protein
MSSAVTPARTTQEGLWTTTHSLSDWLSYVLLAGGVAVIAFMAYSVYLVYTPLFWVDQWMFLQNLIADRGRIGVEFLWKQHNEHRIPVPKLFDLADLYLFGGRNLFLHLSVFALQFAHLAWLAVVFQRLGQLRGTAWRVAVAVATVCLFSMRQSENFWFPWNIAMILPYLGATIAFSSLGFFYQSRQEQGHGQFRYMLCAWAGVLIGSLSLSSGLLLWPMLVVTMLGLRLSRWWALATAATSAALIAFWLSGYSGNVVHYKFPSVTALIRFVLVYFASSWSCVGERFGLLLAAIALPASAAAYIWVLLMRHKDVFAIVLLSTAMFAFASAAVVAVGRVGFGIQQARTDRYQTGAMLFWCCVFVLLIRQCARSERAPALLLWLQAAFVYVLLAAAQLGPQVADGARIHANSFGAAAVALEAGVNDSPTIMYAATAPYRAEDILLMSTYLHARHLSIFNHDQKYPLGREFTRFYRVVPPIACRGELDPIRAFADYRWSGFRFSGWAYDVARREPARAVALVDSSGRLVGVGRSGFLRTDGPTWIQRKRAGFLGYIPADLKTQEARVFAILEDGVSACPLIGAQTVHLDVPATMYSGLEPTGATKDLTRDLKPAAMIIETLAGKPLPSGPQPIPVESGGETSITGWIVDSNGRSGAAADLVVDDVPLAAEYGYQRLDVAKSLSSPEANASGFKARLPELRPGEHHIGMRVIPKGKDIYCDAWTLTILVR